MKDVQKLFNECVMEMESIGMDISTRILEVKVNSRLSRALGRCGIVYRTMEGGAWYRIEIQPNMLADGIADRVPKNTLMHELIHTCPGCMNHGYEFQRRAEAVNRKLGYNIHTTTNSESLEAAGVQLKRKSANYRIVCMKCGKTVETRSRWSSTLEHIGSYRHSNCGGNLKVVGLNGNVIWSAANQHK